MTRILLAMVLLAGGCATRVAPPPRGYTAQQWAEKTWEDEGESLGWNKTKFAPLWSAKPQ